MSVASSNFKGYVMLPITVTKSLKKAFLWKEGLSMSQRLTEMCLYFIFPRLEQNILVGGTDDKGTLSHHNKQEKERKLQEGAR